jgi:hypothetical protein
MLEIPQLKDRNSPDWILKEEKANFIIVIEPHFKNKNTKRLKRMEVGTQY